VCPRSGVSYPSFVDGKGAGEKQDIFPAEVLAFDPWEGVLHDQGTPTAFANFAWFAACSLVRVERFAVVGELKNEFMSSFLDFHEYLALSTPVGVQMNIDEGFVDCGENLSSFEGRKTSGESPLVGESAEALEAGW